MFRQRCCDDEVSTLTCQIQVQSPLTGTKPKNLHSCSDHSCVSSQSVDRGFRQRCSDDEVSTHACYAHMLDPEGVDIDVNETDI